MALHIADYLIIRDDSQRTRPSASFNLPDDAVHGDLANSRVFRFDLPAHAVAEETAILAYMLDPVPFGGEVDVTYEIRLNDRRIARRRIETTMVRGLWEQVRGNLLWERSTDEVDVPSNNNILEFRSVRRRSEGGHLHFSSAVLWFQRAVAEP